MMKTQWRLAGVLGGMGPLATVDFLSKVIAVTPAGSDQEHVPLIVHQVPQIPDRSTAILQGTDAPLGPMLAGLQRLARAGADFAVIPCNTAHRWHDQLTRMQPLNILHIADATRLELERHAGSARRVALLASRGALLAGVYKNRLGHRFEPHVPIDPAVQSLVDRSIAAVKAGDRNAGAAAAHETAVRLFDQGAELLILACTELPVAFADSAFQDRCIDSTLALARACVREAMSADAAPVVARSAPH